MKRIMLAIVLAVVMVFSTGCTTRVVPPGTVVIVLKSDGSGEVHTEGSYMAWGRDRVYFVDTKLKSFTESMNILCADNINMKVDVKWVGSFDVSANKIKIIKEKVPADKVDTGDITGYQLSLHKFYATAMKDIIRANTRNIVAPYVTDSIREERSKIQLAVKKAVLERFKQLNYPIKTTDIMVSNIDYPAEITAQRKAIKNAQLENERQAALAKAAIEQAKREAAIAREEGKAQIEKAKADAKANEIRTKSLTPAIIAMRQWDVLEKLGTPNCDDTGKCTEPAIDMIFVPYSGVGESTINSTMIRQLRK